ncbi:hypothetical protein DH2020_044892 [Rehmannia glutinosa]|uniref:BZIP domain-containing protein n=1 Tax=Rehmannia glutinosa TaxID=99300 RepID=A0ABR0UHD3_REHGL
MANSKESSSIRSVMYNGKNSLLPPKSPYPSISPSYTEYIPNSAIGPKALPKPRDGNSHQRISSESFLIDEQPSWLDELLNEPETPVRRGDVNLSGKTKNKPWDAPINSIAPPRGLPSPRDIAIVPNPGSLSTSQDADRNPTSSAGKQDVEYGSQDPKGSFEKNDSFHVSSLASETDTKRSKQQFAQRSRVRKLQYIAELERNAEGSEVSAELEFLNQQTLILSLENKALKQRLEGLSQEQVIKYLEHEVLEREAGRLRNLYKQQQQHQHPQQQQLSSGHRRAKSRDLDKQFTNLSLKPKEASAGHDSVSSQLHI